jgi:hypothetical protein
MPSTTAAVQLPATDISTTTAVQLPATGNSTAAAAFERQKIIDVVIEFFS